MSTYDICIPVVLLKRVYVVLCIQSVFCVLGETNTWGLTVSPACLQKTYLYSSTSLGQSHRHWC